MDVKFEEMRLEHLSQVMEIEKASFPSPWSRYSFVNEVMKNSFAYYIVAVSDKNVVGYAGMWLILDEAHITSVAVHPHHRGNGIGRALMQEMVRRAAIMGINKMTLEVRPSNTAARHLYATLGFIERGVRKGYYADTREDAIIMWKDDISGKMQNISASRYI